LFFFIFQRSFVEWKLKKLHHLENIHCCKNIIFIYKSTLCCKETTQHNKKINIYTYKPWCICFSLYLMYLKSGLSSGSSFQQSCIQFDIYSSHIRVFVFGLNGGVSSIFTLRMISEIWRKTSFKSQSVCKLLLLFLYVNKSMYKY
jgi:hypothetical protein